jgi:hypothetical protein
MLNIYSDISGFGSSRNRWKWYGFAWIIVESKHGYCDEVVDQDYGTFQADSQHAAELVTSVKALQSLPNHTFAKVHTDIDTVHKILENIKDRNKKYDDVPRNKFNAEKLNNLILEENKRLKFAFFYEEKSKRSHFYHCCHIASRTARMGKFVIPSLCMSFRLPSLLQPRLKTINNPRIHQPLYQIKKQQC